MKKVIGLIVTVVAVSVFGAGVAIAQTLLISTGSNTIRKFSLSGQDLGIFASSLNNPVGMAFERAGNLYVANVFGNNIHKFSPTGQDLGDLCFDGHKRAVISGF